jgi:peptidoglycan hydrolase CwlO-like protein
LDLRSARRHRALIDLQSRKSHIETRLTDMDSKIADLDAKIDRRDEAVEHHLAAIVTLGSRLETTNRNEGRRLLGLTVRTTATSSLKACRFIVAVLPP